MARTIIKNIETQIAFSNEDVIAALMQYAKIAEDKKPTLYLDGDSCYCDFEIRFWEKTTEEVE